jgi:hypothetical protein
MPRMQQKHVATDLTCDYIFVIFFYAYLDFREPVGRLIKAHCDQARTGAGTVGKIEIHLRARCAARAIQIQNSFESLSLRIEL